MRAAQLAFAWGFAQGEERLGGGGWKMGGGGGGERGGFITYKLIFVEKVTT